MATVKLVDEKCDDPVVRRVFDDIKATKNTDRIANIWRALATNPEHLELCWTRLKAINEAGPAGSFEQGDDRPGCLGDE